MLKCKPLCPWPLPVVRGYGVPTTDVELYSYNRNGNPQGTYRVGAFDEEGNPVEGARVATSVSFRSWPDQIKPGTLCHAMTASFDLTASFARIAGADPSKLKLDGLRERYQASMSTLRETLNRLASEGFVLAEEQRGFFVAPVSKEDLSEVAELRILLE